MSLSRWRVPLGFLVGGCLLFLARPSPRSVLVGLPLALGGELIRLWASGHIEKTRRLATGGPYAHTRNPLYVGSVLLALGFACATASLWVTLGVVFYFGLFYPAVIREEAAFLRGKFGAEYADWEREVPAFFPRLRPAGPRATRFTCARVRENREWRALLALPLLAAVLYLRWLWPR